MRNLHYLPKLTLIFSRPELMAIHMQDNNFRNVQSEKYSSETINIWPSTSSACVIPSGCKNKQKKKGKKVLGLENFPSIIEVLNPNDLFDEKSKIFPKLFSHKSSLFNIEGITNPPKHISILMNYMQKLNQFCNSILSRPSILPVVPKPGALKAPS